MNKEAEKRRQKYVKAKLEQREAFEEELKGYFQPRLMA